MTTCPRCGQEISTGSSLCSACGQVLRSPEEAAPSPSASASIQITDVKIGDYFKSGWEIFKKYPAGFLGFSVIILITSIILKWVPLLGGVVASLLIFPLYAGYFVVSAKLLENQVPEFLDFFSGFKFFKQLVLLGVVSLIMVILGLILLLVPGIYLGVGYSFALMLLVDQKLDFWPAMELSRLSVQTNWFKIFVFLLLLMLINLVSLLLLKVGKFFAPSLAYYLSTAAFTVSSPLTQCIQTAAFADIFGFKSVHKISLRS